VPEEPGERDALGGERLQLDVEPIDVDHVGGESGLVAGIEEPVPSEDRQTPFYSSARHGKRTVPFLVVDALLDMYGPL
jgi:hypothetical protein